MAAPAAMHPKVRRKEIPATCRNGKQVESALTEYRYSKGILITNNEKEKNVVNELEQLFGYYEKLDQT